MFKKLFNKAFNISHTIPSRIRPSDLCGTYADTATRLYVGLFRAIPNDYALSGKKQYESFLKIINKYKSDITTSYLSKTDKSMVSHTVVFDNFIVIYSGYSFTLNFLYKDFDNKIMQYIINNIAAMEENKQRIGFIVKSSFGYQVKSTELEERDINIDTNYNDDLVNTNVKIVDKLNKDISGIYMFHGEPGTGKSNYIRYLKTQTKKDFIFVPIEIAQHLDSPELFNIFLSNPKSVLVIEDAEKLIVSREMHLSSHLAGLLNLADGLVGQLLNIQVICTFNTNLDNVDPALLRKGRLIESYKFGKLTISKTENLFKKFGYAKAPSEEMVLTDIYNYDQQESELNIPQRKKIGFVEVE